MVAMLPFRFQEEGGSAIGPTLAVVCVFTSRLACETVKCGEAL